MKTQRVMKDQSFPTAQIALLTVSKDGPLYVISLTAPPDNRFSLPFIKAFHSALDAIESDLKSGEPAALITVNSNGKIYSNGLMLENVMGIGRPYFIAYQNFLERFLTFRLPTIAAIDGHAFAGGCMFALAHDYRVMRQDKGFICMNEIDLPAGLTPGMMAVIRTKLPSPQIFRKCVLEGHRFSGEEAFSAGFVDLLAQKNESVLTIAKSIAGKIAEKNVKAGRVIEYLKKEMYAETSRLLTNGEVGQVWRHMEDMSRSGLSVPALNTRIGPKL